MTLPDQRERDLARSRRTRATVGPRTIAAAIGCAVAFVVTAALAWHGHVAGFDRSLTARLVRQQGSAGFRFGDLVSTVSSGPVAGLLAVVFGAWIWWRTRNLVIAAVTPAAGALGGITELIAKSVVGRLRPPTAAMTGESGFGFPSGHTTGLTALVVGAVLTMALIGAERRRVVAASVAAVLSAIVVGISRVLVGAHYALDAFAGLALGALCAFVALAAATLSLTVRLGAALDDRVDALLARRSSARPT